MDIKALHQPLYAKVNGKHEPKNKEGEREESMLSLLVQAKKDYLV